MATTVVETLAAFKAAAQEIVDKATAENRDLTTSEKTAFDEAVASYEATQKRAEQAAALGVKLDAMNPDRLDLGEADTDHETGSKAATLGERFTSGGSYKQFNDTAKRLGGLGRNANISIDPTKVGSFKDFLAARKGAALTTDLAHLQNVRLPMIDQVDRPELTLLDLISKGTTRGAFEYLQVLAVQRNTAIIPENTGVDPGVDAEDNPIGDTIKPESSFTTALADAKVYDYADGYTVTNQLLQDDQALASYLNGEFRYSFDTILADKLLNGSGTNGEPRGLLNTTGVLAQSYATQTAMALIEAARKSITQLRHASNLAMLVSPEDAEMIDLAKDGNDRFYGNGPFGLGPDLLWGRRRVVSDQLEAGQSIMGDFRQIALLDRSGLSIQAFNQHKDYASRNLTYVRAELRAAQAIWRPSHFVVIEKA